jgi:hypothetical protein
MNDESFQAYLLRQIPAIRKSAFGALFDRIKNSALPFLLADEQLRELQEPTSAFKLTHPGYYLTRGSEYSHVFWKTWTRETAHHARFMLTAAETFSPTGQQHGRKT